MPAKGKQEEVKRESVSDGYLGSFISTQRQAVQIFHALETVETVETVKVVEVVEIVEVVKVVEVVNGKQ